MTLYEWWPDSLDTRMPTCNCQVEGGRPCHDQKKKTTGVQQHDGHFCAGSPLPNTGLVVGRVSCHVYRCNLPNNQFHSRNEWITPNGFPNKSEKLIRNYQKNQSNLRLKTKRSAPQRSPSGLRLMRWYNILGKQMKTKFKHRQPLGKLTWPTFTSTSTDNTKIDTLLCMWWQFSLKKSSTLKCLQTAVFEFLLSVK